MPEPTGAPSHLSLGDLHAALSDPLLDTMNFLNEITARFPGAVSFAPGRPYEEPVDAGTIARYLEVYGTYLRRERGQSAAQVSGLLFQYGRTNGQIHELVAATVANDEGIRVPAGAVVVTVGAQEGMLLVLRALFRDPRDVLLVSSPCYVGITGAARLLDIAVEPVPEGPDGACPAALREAARRVRAGGRRPRAFYVVPDFANPSGTSMPAAARAELLGVAAAEDLLVLEDNPYGLFARDAVPPPTLKRLDRDRRVVYLGTFAKTCFPGARVGYVLADQPVAVPGGTTLLADQLSKIKSMTTVNTSPLAQAVIGGMLLACGCRLRAASGERVARYRSQLTALLDALAEHFPPARRDREGIAWNAPAGGFFLVLRVPFVADEAALARSAAEHGVLWTPMRYFHLDGGGKNQLRLSCSYLDPARIRDGVRRLSDFVAAG
ncbi:MAG TPA: PLP-dependent aminotransferase family protein [Rugosimonospora sp.]|nr:PLP-dependent aminotransferase family protein [Rugosimonospora sp.]